MATPTTPDRPTTEPIRPEGRALTGIAPESPGGSPADPSPATTAAPPLRSIHTGNFSAILQELGVSLLVTTCQAGKLVVLHPGVRYSDVINDQPRVIADSFVVPDEAPEFMPGPLRHAA